MKFLILILTVTDDNILLKMKHKECNFMMTYKNLYCALVRSMSEAIDLYDEGKVILARETLHKALLDAEDQVISHDIIPDEPISSAASAEN
jgi:sulfur relay (sulfurtransferase) DsrF/TusC family protein